MLYIVSTPIGNLDDITHRAVRTLAEAHLILAEDTRTSRRLLDHYGITAPMAPYHDHNKERVTPGLVEQLSNGKEIAMITDAGTPGVADPAFYLVRAAIKAGVRIVPLPGPSAFLAALVCSGLPTDRFVFENFLPHKSARRLRLFEEFKTEPRTIIVYETPHRILKVLEEINSVLGDVVVVIGRELTKIHEEFLRDTPARLLAHFAAHPPRGEMVVLFNSRFRVSDQAASAQEAPCDPRPGCSDDD